MILALALACTTQAGAVLTMRNHVEPPVILDVIPGAFQSARLVRETPLVWIGFAIDHGDSAYLWPRGERIWITLKDGTEVRDSLALVTGSIEPPTFRMEPYFFGPRAVWFEPERHWRKRFPWGRVCTVAMVGFPGDFRVSDVARVRTGVKGEE